MSADVATSRWEALLDELEADVQRAQELLARPSAGTAPDDGLEQGTTAAALALAAPWVPPTDLGPVPGALRVRAEAVAAQQRALTATLTETLASTRAHLRITDTLSRRNAPQAVYIDTLG